jgi:hypothetical protein
MPATPSTASIWKPPADVAVITPDEVSAATFVAAMVISIAPAAAAAKLVAVTVCRSLKSPLRCGSAGCRMFVAVTGALIATAPVFASPIGMCRGDAAQLGIRDADFYRLYLFRDRPDARCGLDEAENAGPRVEAPVELRSRSSAVRAKVGPAAVPRRG